MIFPQFFVFKRKEGLVNFPELKMECLGHMKEFTVIDGTITPGLNFINRIHTTRYTIMKRIGVLKDLIQKNKTRINGQDICSHRKLSRRFSDRIRFKKVIKLPCSFRNKRSSYLNIFKKHVLYILLVARSIMIKGTIL